MMLKFKNTYKSLGDMFISPFQPSDTPSPELLHANSDLAKAFHLNDADLRSAEFAQKCTLNQFFEGSSPVATAYAGHQFGHFVPQLGDGRAVLLGDVVDKDGQSWEFQVKGSGPTYFSRGFDGRAVLRSTIREYLCSEAMHGLGVPTTRSLALFKSPLPVQREQLESAALLVRLAESHVRFGTFEYFYYQGKYEELRLLVDFVISNYFAHLKDKPDKYALLFDEIVDRTAKLMSYWMAFGFSHGVMNTDNMSILGLTIDYGPYGFMDDYDPGYICNHSDREGRYAFNQQPQIGLWNLNALAQTFTQFVDHKELEKSLKSYQDKYLIYQSEIHYKKFGLFSRTDGDSKLMNQFYRLLEENQADFTCSFRELSNLSLNEEKHRLTDYFVDREGINRWIEDYKRRIRLESVDNEKRMNYMKRFNPKYVLRNYLAQTAIEKAEKGDYKELDTLFNILQAPFDEQEEFSAYAKPSPEWGKTLTISCSS